MTIKVVNLPRPEPIKNQSITIGSVVIDPKKEMPVENISQSEDGINNLQKAIENSAFKGYVIGAE